MEVTKNNYKIFSISAHRGESIVEALEKCLQDWGVERVFTVIVDNASPNGVATNI